MGVGVVFLDAATNKLRRIARFPPPPRLRFLSLEEGWVAARFRKVVLELEESKLSSPEVEFRVELFQRHFYETRHRRNVRFINENACGRKGGADFCERKRDNVSVSNEEIQRTYECTRELLRARR